MSRIKTLALKLTASLAVLLIPGSALAHVTIKPAEVKTATYQTFTVSVPNEKEAPTSSIKLAVPSGIESVTPTVKAGWTIVVDNEGEGETDLVKSITWSGGQIPDGQRDEFTFSAKVADQPIDYQWKAYQTYSTGEVVSWDKEPTAESEESETSGPYSLTKVVTSLSTEGDSQSVSQATQDAKNLSNRAMIISFISLLVSLSAVFMVIKKNR